MPVLSGCLDFKHVRDVDLILVLIEKNLSFQVTKLIIEKER